MFASAVRSAARTTARPLKCSLVSQSRYSSTSTSSSEETPSSSSKPPSPQVYLNPERKRKLVSLYHQAEDFIGDKDLESRIDREFAKIFTGSRSEQGRPVLMVELEDRRAYPKMDTYSSAAPERSSEFRFSIFRNTTPRSEKAKARKSRVRAAIYGLDESYKASLEMVEESKRSNPAPKTSNE